MNTLEISSRRHRAVRDDLRQVLAALGAELAQSPARRDLTGIFERELQRALALHAIRLREIPQRYQASSHAPTRTPESIVLGVPSGDPRVQVVLEASGGPDRYLDDTDHALLSMAATLGGLVLEATRGRTLSPRVPDRTMPLVGSTPVMQTLRERVARVAATDFTVLIEGESGTGKELVARQLHDVSRRRNGPFVAVNCAAVVETLLEAELFGIEDGTATGVRGRRGKFELAEGGTLFLDEVSDLSLSAQAKLLRALQDLSIERVGGHGARRVNLRVIVATNRALKSQVANAQFRGDLYYRLSGVEIQVPSLRQRRDDIPELARHFLARHAGTRSLALSRAAEEALWLYAWPGNVRELERLMERSVALAAGEWIELEDLPPHIRGDYTAVLGHSLSAGDSLRAWSSRYVRLVFERCGRNKSQTCRELKISYHTLEAYLSCLDPSFHTSARPLPGWVTSGGDRMTADPDCCVATP